MKTLGDTARLLRKKPYQVTYVLTTGLVEEPRLRIGGKRIFQAEDLHRLAGYFGLSLKPADIRKWEGEA